MSLNPIEFRNMIPDAELGKYAGVQLNRIMSLAPPGSVCVTVLAKTGRAYQCSMDICSRFGPFLVRAESSSPRTAVELMLKKAEKKFVNWQERKFDKVRPIVREFSLAAETERTPLVIAGTA